MNRWTVFLAAAAVCFFVAVGCSGGDGSPVTPTGDPAMTGSTTHTGQAQTHLWGYYTCYVDIENQTIEAVPDRYVMGVEPSPFNVVNFINSKPANLRFNINGMIVEDAYLDVDIYVTIIHPFPGLMQYNGYDVRGIFIGNGSATLQHNGLRYPRHGADQVADRNLKQPPPDDNIPVGYTRWWNPTEFTMPGILGYTPGAYATPGYSGNSRLNAYEYFADGLAQDENLWDFLTSTSNNGEFRAGNSNTRRYYIRFPTPSPGVVFNYAIAASWEGEDVHPANAAEALAVNVEQTEHVFYVDSSEWGGNLVLDVGIFEWSGIVDPYGDFPYDVTIESDVLLEPYTLNDAEMIPVNPAASYPTFHVVIPADNVTGTEGNECWVMVESHDNDYLNDYGVPNAAGTDILTAYFRFGITVLAEPPCTNPTVEEMVPDTAGVNEVVDDAEILGFDFEDGPFLACYLTNGTVDIIGTDVTWYTSDQVEADFDFGAAGATEGDYDLHFTDGDGCTVILEDAMTLVEASWPVQVDSGTTYYGPKFIEDSNGVFHIFCSSSTGVPGGGVNPPFEMHWFISEDAGLTWSPKGNIWTWPHSTAGVTGPSTGHAASADGNGGVYLGLPERLYTSSSGQDMYIAYLDTDSLGSPSTWDVSDWEYKRIIDGYVQHSYVCVSPDGQILVVGRLSTLNCPYLYASDWSALPSSPPYPPTRLHDSGKLIGIYPREMVQSPNNEILYDESTGNFVFAMGGRWNVSTSSDCGGFLLDYDPTADTFTAVEEIGYHFVHNSGLGDFCLQYFGDLVLDSSGNLHWVHQIQIPTNEPTSWYSRLYCQYYLCYATNETGSWSIDIPINDPSTSYIQPYPADDGNSDHRRLYERVGINMVGNSSDELIMVWMKSWGDPKFMGANTIGGSWSDPPNILEDTDGDHPLYTYPYGEAYGSMAAITFTSQDTPSSSTNASLYFTMTDGE